MRRSMTVAAIAAAAVFMTACGSDEASDPAASSGGTTKVTVGVIPIVDVAPIYLGKEQGFFSERGIDLTLESGQGGAAIVPGVVSGQFQFGFSNVTSLMLAKSKNVPVKVVSNGVASTGEDGADYSAVVVAADSPVQSAADLAGKRVAVNTLNNIGDTTVRASIRKDGGDATGVKFAELAFPDMPAALEQGNVDAIWVVEPFLSIAKAAGAREVASNYVDAAPDLSVAAYFTSTQTAESNADLVTRFTEAMNESLTYASENPDAVRQILTTYTKIDAKVIESLTLPTWPTEINRASLDALAKLAVDDGLIEGTPDLDALLP